MVSEEISYAAQVMTREQRAQWMAENMKKEDFAELPRLYLRNFALALAQKLGLNFGMEESCNWPSSKIVKLVEKNFEKLQKAVAHAVA